MRLHPGCDHSLQAQELDPTAAAASRGRHGCQNKVASGEEQASGHERPEVASRDEEASGITESLSAGSGGLSSVRCPDGLPVYGEILRPHNAVVQSYLLSIHIFQQWEKQKKRWRRCRNGHQRPGPSSSAPVGI